MSMLCPYHSKDEILYGGSLYRHFGLELHDFYRI